MSRYAPALIAHMPGRVADLLITNVFYEVVDGKIAHVGSMIKKTAIE
ncbi:hypothetical protein [Pseudomonas sp. 1152_12]